MKFTLTAVPGRYTLPAKPSVTASSIDAYKQTQFMLGEDLALFERAMNLQLEIVAANKKARTQGSAALLFPWSRTFSNLSAACTLMIAGEYTSCPPVLRSALDGIAAQRSLATDPGEYDAWSREAVTQAKEHQALAFDLGRFRAGSVLAEDGALGPLYRLLTDLSMPHFGSTALLTAPDSGLTRLGLAFADTSFHLGWAELVSGWLLTLAGAQLELLAEQRVLVVDDGASAAIRRLGQDTAKITSNRRRCRAEEVDGRFLFHNFRRAASGQPKRVML